MENMWKSRRAARIAATKYFLAFDCKAILSGIRTEDENGNCCGAVVVVIQGDMTPDNPFGTAWETFMYPFDGVDGE